MHIAPPPSLAMLYVNFTVEFPSKDIELSLESMAPPKPIATLLVKNTVMEYI